MKWNNNDENNNSDSNDNVYVKFACNEQWK